MEENIDKKEKTEKEKKKEESESRREDWRKTAVRDSCICGEEREP